MCENYVYLAGGAWMFDCGEGTVRQMIESSVRAGKLDSVFITHLHGDHVRFQSHNIMFITIHNLFSLVLWTTWTWNETNWNQKRGYKPICPFRVEVILGNFDHC